MNINLSPQRRDDTLTASIDGHSITLNGETFNFAALPEGGQINAYDVPCDWIIGTIERIAGQVSLTLIMPHGPNPPHHVAFPEPLIAGNGPVLFPTENADNVDG